MRESVGMGEGHAGIILTTPRLHLRTFRPDDLPLYAALNADPRVMQWLGGVPLTPADSDEMASYANGLFAAERIGLLAVERRRDGVFLGMCGLHHLDSLPGEVEVAWRLAYPHWGNGYATEAASAWLDYAFDALELPRVISVTDPPNTRSLGVMRRLGMTFEREADVEDGGIVFRALVFGIAVDAWRARRRSGP